MAVVFAGFTLCSVFSKEVLDENLRFELNVSDTFGTRMVNFSNCTDLGVDITSKNNTLGGRVGVMVRETWMIGSESVAFGFSLNPYIGFSFFNGCLMGGALFYPEASLCVPYVGFNWDFDVIPVKNGFSHSFAIRVGVDWYPVYVGSGDAATAIVGTILGSMIPNFYVGGTYKFGRGMKVGKKSADTTETVFLIDEPDSTQEESPVEESSVEEIPD